MGGSGKGGNSAITRAWLLSIALSEGDNRTGNFALNLKLPQPTTNNADQYGQIGYIFSCHLVSTGVLYNETKLFG